MRSTPNSNASGAMSTTGAGVPVISLSSAFSHSGRSTSWAAAARCRATTSTAAACLQSWATGQLHWLRYAVTAPVRELARWTVTR